MIIYLILIPIVVLILLETFREYEKISFTDMDGFAVCVHKTFYGLPPESELSAFGL